MLSHDIIIRPVITEQSMTDSAEKKYTFIVDRRANKTQIKNAVQEVFSVQVDKVNTMNYQGKKKRMGRHVGKTASYKKTVVTLSKASKEIEFFVV